jgi:hypothetical protein
MIETGGIERFGDLKTFIHDFQVKQTPLTIVPTTGKKLQLSMVRGVLGVNTENVATVFEVYAGGGIVKQLYYPNFETLLAQMDEVKVIDSIYYFKKVYVQKLNEKPFELLSSLGMQLKIYFTADAEHTSGLTAYTEKVLPLGKKDTNNPANPVVSCTLETLSFDE